MAPISLRMEDSNLSSWRRMPSLSSGDMVFIPACGMASSNRSSWRRVRSMKARPSAYVAVRVFSPKAITLHADINTSWKTRFEGRDVGAQIVPKVIAAAKHIQTDHQHGRQRRCGICAGKLWHKRHGYGWYIHLFLTTKSRTLPIAFFTFELCKGDLSIRLFSSTGCVFLASFPTTFSASKGRF
jgi:hypothetical protein